MMSDLRHRLAGVTMLLCSVGTSLLHRHVLETAKNGPAQLGELACALFTFALASTGILLVINGSALFRRVRSATTPDPARIARRAVVVDSLLATGSPAAVLLDSRHGVAQLLAERTLAAATTYPPGRATKTIEDSVDQPRHKSKSSRRG